MCFEINNAAFLRVKSKQVATAISLIMMIMKSNDNESNIRITLTDNDYNNADKDNAKLIMNLTMVR